MAYNQEVVSLNPYTIYWMDVSDAKAITLSENGENKGSQMWHTKKKKIIKKKLLAVK